MDYELWALVGSCGCMLVVDGMRFVPSCYPQNTTQIRLSPEQHDNDMPDTRQNTERHCVKAQKSLYRDYVPSPNQVQRDPRHVIRCSVDQQLGRTLVPNAVPMTFQIHHNYLMLY